MEIQIRYCEHCGTEYNFQTSGEGCFDQKVSGKYCEECFSVVSPIIEKYNKDMQKALFNIPIKYEFRWVEDDPLLFDEIYVWMKHLNNSMRMGGLNEIQWLYSDTKYKGYKRRIAIHNSIVMVESFKNVKIEWK